MKQCNICNEFKLDSEFYVGAAKCKPCNIQHVKEYRLKNIDRIREYDRKRGARQTQEYHQNHRAKFPGKYKAKNMLNNALRDGKLTKPVLCQYCGTYSTLHGHHCDYSKPLDVQWLCVPCHKQWHIANGEGLNGA